jgi:outer membrane receptor protein involved in Fe transport
VGEIYIDGKTKYFIRQDLNAYLKSIQSSDVDSIEIITQPSSKYDAAGNAGIVNIKLKKDKRFGTNGSVALGYGLVDLANMTAHFRTIAKKDQFIWLLQQQV